MSESIDYNFEKDIREKGDKLENGGHLRFQQCTNYKSCQYLKQC